MIGKNIQRIRKKRNYSLSELADRAQISKSYLSNIERNLNQNPSIHIIESISSVLEVDFRTLLGVKAINELLPEKEWIEFVNELKKSGVEKEHLKEYKTVIEFAKWKNKQIEK